MHHLLGVHLHGRYLAQIMSQPDGTFLVSVGATVMSVMGSDEALGLRLRLDGIGTIMLPTVYDPSELRSEFNGKAQFYETHNPFPLDSHTVLLGDHG